MSKVRTRDHRRTRRSRRVVSKSGQRPVQTNMDDGVIRAALRNNPEEATPLVRRLLRIAGRPDLFAHYGVAPRKRGRRPGLDVPTRFSRVVWQAANYRISYTTIARTVRRPWRWVQTRVKQTEAAIANGDVINADALRHEYDHLTPAARRTLLLDRLKVMRARAIE